MTWEAAPTGKRGRQPSCSDSAIQTCLTMKVLFGMALRQTTGCVESLLRLIARDFDRQVAEFQIRVAVHNGFTALGTPIIEVAG